MPSQLLPIFTPAEVAAHSSKQSCYVTVGLKVYNVTDFIHSHPGGAELILDYAGRDVDNILRDEDSHFHSEAAYDVLDESLVGFLVDPTDGKTPNEKTTDAIADGKAWVHPRTGLSCEADLSRDTDFTDDYKKHQFLDLGRPLFPQLWFGGFSKEFYLDQVHRPRHYRGGESAPLFGNFLEPLTKTAWWVIPTVWLPCIAFAIRWASKGLAGLPLVLYLALGFLGWTLVEYLMHRFLFHLDHFLPDNRVGIAMHFLFHGIHHYLPMDKYRLVLPPTLLVILGFPFWKLAHFVFASWFAATAVFSGGVFGYVCYDLTHYFIHHESLPLWYKDLKKYHLQHHFLDYQNGFGVTSRFWDNIFGTELKPQARPT